MKTRREKSKTITETLIDRILFLKKKKIEMNNEQNWKINDLVSDHMLMVYIISDYEFLCSLFEYVFGLPWYRFTFTC